MTSRISGFAGPQRQERESSEDGENVVSEPGPWASISNYSHYTDDKPRPEISLRVWRKTKNTGGGLVILWEIRADIPPWYWKQLQCPPQQALMGKLGGPAVRWERAQGNCKAAVGLEGHLWVSQQDSRLPIGFCFLLLPKSSESTLPPYPNPWLSLGSTAPLERNRTRTGGPPSNSRSEGPQEALWRAVMSLDQQQVDSNFQHP